MVLTFEVFIIILFYIILNDLLNLTYFIVPYSSLNINVLLWLVNVL